MCSIEEALKKKGPELFRELLRIFPVAEVEDYWKNGAWKDDLMKTDLQLIEAHRKEAGAPDPLPLEEVVMPPLPKSFTNAFGMQMGKSPGVGVLLVQPFGHSPAGHPGAPSAAASGTTVSELRLIALFVAKWKLEPTKAKTILTELQPHRRRYVIQHFKVADGAEDPTAELETYISECEANNAWGNAVPSPVKVATNSAMPRPIAPRPLAFGTQPMLTGVKRPLASIMPVMAFDPNKRLRPIYPVSTTIRPVVRPGYASAGQALIAGRLAAASRGPLAPMRPHSATPVARPMGSAMPRLISPMMTRPAMVRPMSSSVIPSRPQMQPFQPGASFPRPGFAPVATRPVFGNSAGRPVMMASAKPGSLIRNLLQKY